MYVFPKLTCTLLISIFIIMQFSVSLKIVSKFSSGLVGSRQVSYIGKWVADPLPSVSGKIAMTTQEQGQVPVS